MSRSLLAGEVTGRLGNSESAWIPDDERRALRSLQFHDPNGVPAQKIFNLGRPVVAVLEADHLWRRAAGTGEVEEIGIGRNNGQPVRPRKLPNGFVRRKAGEPRVENVDRIREEFRETLDELRREIRVE